jgi:hypothetical protein
MFVFNGFGKVSPGTVTTKPGGPGPFRLLVPSGWHSDLLFGCVLVAALALGIVGAVVAMRRRGAGSQIPRLPRAFATALAVWIAISIVVFDTLSTVHARYLEALAPALAIAIGYGAAVLSGLDEGPAVPSLPSIVGITLALGATCAYTFGFKPPSLAWGVGALGFAAAGAALVARAPGRLGAGAKSLTAGLVVGSALLFPVHESLVLVRSAANDSLGLATALPGNAAALSKYLAPRTIGVRYELAVDEPLALAPLVIRDRRPLLPLTSFGGQPLIGLHQLLHAVRSGRVRYGLVADYHCVASTSRWAACGAAAQWIRANGVDVTAAVGLRGASRLYLLAPGRAG